MESGPRGTGWVGESVPWESRTNEPAKASRKEQGDPMEERPQNTASASGPCSEPTPEPPEQTIATDAHAPKTDRVGVLAIAVVCSLLVGALAGLVGGYAAYRLAPEDEKSESTSSTLGGDTVDEVVAAAAAAALPSVVNIDVTGGSARQGDLPSDHPDVPIQGEGSGVAYRSETDGGTYIITNNHVVDGATDIVVTDSEGERRDAKLIGGDDDTDIAVLLVDGRIPTIDVGDIDSVVVGQLAIAIGSPFGLDHSVTAGVISALHRPLTGFGTAEGQYPYIDSIQTDASINPGNSGGALVDRSGKLIGIPSVIYTQTGASEGVGLAIPVDRATRAADQLIEKGRVDTPFLGVVGQTVTSELAKQEGLPVDEGAYVVEVTPDSEAEKAGIKAGDVIVAVDKDRIRTMDELVLAVRRRAVGDKVTVALWRNGEKTTVEMKIGVKPSGAGSR